MVKFLKTGYDQNALIREQPVKNNLKALEMQIRLSSQQARALCKQKEFFTFHLRVSKQDFPRREPVPRNRYGEITF